jgi:hypothetical protein
MTDRKGWQPYPHSTNEVIAEHVARGVTRIGTTLSTDWGDTWQYEIDLIANIQRNVATKKERPIRLQPTDGLDVGVKGNQYSAARERLEHSLKGLTHSSST